MKQGVREETVEWKDEQTGEVKRSISYGIRNHFEVDNYHHMLAFRNLRKALFPHSNWNPATDLNDLPSQIRSLGRDILNAQKGFGGMDRDAISRRKNALLQRTARLSHRPKTKRRSLDLFSQ